MSGAREFVNMVNWGCYKKARVTAVQKGVLTLYQVLDPGRLDGAPILDEKIFYTMDHIFRITQRLNERAGRSKPSRWVQFIDQE